MTPLETSLAATITTHLEALAASGYASSTINARRLYLTRFACWATPRGMLSLEDLTPGVLETYSARLSGRRTAHGDTLACSTYAQHLAAVKQLCAWATRTKRLVVNPASDIALPRLPKRLPRAVLSESEAERVLATPDASVPSGLRDRAILEVLYSTGIRRRELTNLDVTDIDYTRGVLFVREGKGRKDRLVPVGQRALGWLKAYTDHARPGMACGGSQTALFLSGRGLRIKPNRLTERLHGYIVTSGVAKPGSVHIFRHTMATLMHDGGADIRDLQEMLGHAQLSTTQLYTHVAIERLCAVHKKTHPAETSRSDLRTRKHRGLRPPKE